MQGINSEIPRQNTDPLPAGTTIPRTPQAAIPAQAGSSSQVPNAPNGASAFNFSDIEETSTKGDPLLLKYQDLIEKISQLRDEIVQQKDVDFIKEINKIFDHDIICEIAQGQIACDTSKKLFEAIVNIAKIEQDSSEKANLELSNIKKLICDAKDSYFVKQEELNQKIAEMLDTVENERIEFYLYLKQQDDTNYLIKKFKELMNKNEGQELIEYTTMLKEGGVTPLVSDFFAIRLLLEHSKFELLKHYYDAFIHDFDRFINIIVLFPEHIDLIKLEPLFFTRNEEKQTLFEKINYIFNHSLHGSPEKTQHYSRLLETLRLKGYDVSKQAQNDILNKAKEHFYIIGTKDRNNITAHLGNLGEIVSSSFHECITCELTNEEKGIVYIQFDEDMYNFPYNKDKDNHISYFVSYDYLNSTAGRGSRIPDLKTRVENLITQYGVNNITLVLFSVPENEIIDDLNQILSIDPDLKVVSIDPDLKVMTIK